MTLPPSATQVLKLHGLEKLTPSVATWSQKKRSPKSGIGLQDALRFFIEHWINYPFATDIVPLDALLVISNIFSNRRWKQDEQKLENENVCARGVKMGGHFMYAMRKLRELPEVDVRFAKMLSLKSLPVYDTPLPYGQLIDEFDSFILFKLKPLRKAMGIAISSSMHTGTIAHVDPFPVNTQMACIAIPSSQTAFSPFVRESGASVVESSLKRKVELL